MAALAFLPVTGFAAPTANDLPPDVPAKHWAAPAVKSVVGENIMGREPDGRFRGDQPVTRYELAVALDRFVRYIEGSRKPLHVEIIQPTVGVPSKASPTVRHALIHLSSNGFLPPHSPLFTKKGDQPVTAKEMTDALASVTLRLSDRAEAPRKN